MMGLMAAQVLDEGGEGSSSGVEHAVAVQGAEEPVQTGENLQDPLPRIPISLLSTCAKVRLLEPSARSGFRVDCRWLFTGPLCRMAGTTLTLSRPSPLWSETGTSRSPRCPPAPCGPHPSSFQVIRSAPPGKCCVRKRQNFLFRPVFFLRGQRHVLASHAGLQETQF